MFKTIILNVYKNKPCHVTILHYLVNSKNGLIHFLAIVLLVKVVCTRCVEELNDRGVVFYVDRLDISAGGGHFTDSVEGHAHRKVGHPDLLGGRVETRPGRGGPRSRTRAAASLSSRPTRRRIPTRIDGDGRRRRVVIDQSLEIRVGVTRLLMMISPLRAAVRVLSGQVGPLGGTRLVHALDGGQVAPHHRGHAGLRLWRGCHGGGGDGRVAR